MKQWLVGLICCLSLPEILLGRIESFPTASTLFASDVILRVSATEIEFSRDELEMTVKKATALKGQIEPSTVVDVTDALPRWPAGFKNYVLFFKTVETGLAPTNNLYYALGLNETPVSNESFSSLESFSNFLASQLAVEQSSENASIQAYLLCTATQPVLNEAWAKVRTNRCKDPYVALAVASVGIRVEGATALKEVPKLPKERAGEDPPPSKFFTSKSKSMICGWMDRNASSQNKEILLDFALFQDDDQFLVGALTGIALVTGAEDLLKVTNIFKRSDISWEAKYSCIRCLGHILKLPDLVPTIDVFKKDQDHYVKLWEAELAKKGL